MSARRWLYVIAIFLAASGAVAEETPPSEHAPPANTKRLLYDCTRYFVRAAARNFSLREAFAPRGVPDAKLDPKTVRPRSAAIEDSLRRGIDALPTATADGVGMIEFLNSIPTIDALTFFRPNDEQKHRIRLAAELLERDIQNHLEQLRSQKADRSAMKFFEEKLRGIREIFRHLDHPPRITAKRTLPPSPRTGNSRGEQHRIYEEVSKWTQWLFGAGSRPMKLLRDAKELLIADQDGITGDNAQLVKYWARELVEDPVLYADALDFYSRLKQLDATAYFRRDPEKGDLILLSDARSPLNAWTVALESTGGDVSRALRAIAVYGHDDVAQTFFESNVYLRLLDFFVPRIDSVLYRNGALDGMEVSDDLRRRFAEIQRDVHELAERYPESNLKNSIHDGAFRSGNYHFIGGALMVHELYRKGNSSFLGVNLPALVSEVAGKMYKRLTMEETYMRADERVLFDAGYPRVDVPKPEGWSDERYGITRLKVRLQLLHLDLTHEQHLKGAQWAYELLRKHGVTRYTLKEAEEAANSAGRP